MNVFRFSCRNFKSVAQLLVGLFCAYVILHMLYTIMMSRQKVDVNSGVDIPDVIPAKLKFGDTDVNGQVQVVVSFDVKDLSKMWDNQNKKKFNVFSAVNLKGLPPDINVVMQNANLCTNITSLEWLIIVKSSPDASDRRQLLRDTWADVRLFRKDLIRVAFLLGQTSDEVVQRALKAEFETHKDIVQGDFLDGEKNTSLKVIMGMKWAIEHCPNARYVVKANDNTFMNIFEMMKIVNLNAERNRLMICPLYMDNMMPILRDSSECGLWCVKDDEFPGRKFFPQYCAGMGFVMSREVVADLFEASKVTPLFWIDDVYITGLVAKQVKREIYYVDILSRFSLKADLVYDQYVNNRTISIVVSVISDVERFQQIWRAVIRRLQPVQFKLLSDSAIARHM